MISPLLNFRHIVLFLEYESKGDVKSQCRKRVIFIIIAILLSFKVY